MSGSAIREVHVLQSLTAHTSDVTSVDFAGDCVLVTGCGDKRVRVWEWQAGQGYTEAYFSPLQGHKYGVTSVQVSPQSTMLASASIDGTTMLWNLRTGSKIHSMVQVGGEAVRVCRFSPDSTLLVTAGDNGQVCLWDLVRRNLVRCFQKHDGAVQSVCFSPDSSWLVTTCTFGVLKLFCVANIIDSCLTDSGVIKEYAWVDDAHDLGIVSSDFSISQRIANSEPFTKLYQLVTCGNDHYVKLWEITVIQSKCETQASTVKITLCRIMEKHGSGVTCVRFNANGSYIVSSGLDKTAVIWETVSELRESSCSYVGAQEIRGVLRVLQRWEFIGDGLERQIGDDLGPGGRLVSRLGAHASIYSCLFLRRFPTEYQTRGGCDEKRGNVCERCPIDAKNTGTGWRDIQRSFLRKPCYCFWNWVSASSRFLFLSLFSNNHEGSRMKPLIVSKRSIRVWSIEMEEESGSEAAIKFHEKPYSPLDGHKYSVNHVEFSPCGSMLASCSLDGTAIIWNTQNGCQAKSLLVNSGSGVRVCRWSPDGKKIATAGDDETTTLWDVNDMEEVCVFRGHSDAVNAIAFTHDSRYLVTGCNEGTWRLFDTELGENDYAAVMICEEAHDLGVQGCDFSPTSGSLTTVYGNGESTVSDGKCYLLATGGNDSLVKLWQIIVSKGNESTKENVASKLVDGDVKYEEKRCLTGHGGNVTCVRFSPTRNEILGSVASDRTARIWSTYSGVCLYVLEEHECLVTSCAFSEDTSLFVTGGLDKTILIWKIPRLLISQNTLMSNLKHNRRQVADWRVEDTLRWLEETGLSGLTEKAATSSLTGRQLLALSEEELMKRLHVEKDEATAECLKTQLYWLKREDSNPVEVLTDDTEIPHEFFCPITHEIMKEPVRCSDGFTYEKAAINEWFLCGKYTSPMTNKALRDTWFIPNVELRNAICTFLHGTRPQA